MFALNIQEEEGLCAEDKSAVAVQRLFRGFKARASLQVRHM
jgi:hypothetical protein